MSDREAMSDQDICWHYWDHGRCAACGAIRDYPRISKSIRRLLSWKKLMKRLAARLRQIGGER